MSGHEKTIRNVVLSTAAINVALSIILVQKYGVEGVAIATATSVVIWNAWMLISVKRYLGFWTIYIPSKSHFEVVRKWGK